MRLVFLLAISFGCACAFVPAPSSFLRSSTFGGSVFGLQQIGQSRPMKLKTGFCLNQASNEDRFEYSNDPPASSLELVKFRFEKVWDPVKLSRWVKDWPYAGTREGYGLPRTLLPTQAELNVDGVKVIFKGTLDPWMQIEVRGNYIHVFRHSNVGQVFVSCSALKKREEGRICEKLMLDLRNQPAESLGGELAEELFSEPPPKAAAPPKKKVARRKAKVAPPPKAADPPKASGPSNPVPRKA